MKYKGNIFQLGASILTTLCLLTFGCGSEYGPQNVGARAILNSDEFPQEQKEAIRICIQELKSDGEDPAEFYACVEPGKELHILVVHLWHESAFRPENRDVLGNPGGKCRDFYFDTNKKQVTQKSFWQ